MGTPSLLSEATLAKVQRWLSQTPAGTPAGYAPGAGTRQVCHVVVQGDGPDIGGWYLCEPIAFDSSEEDWSHFARSKCKAPNGEKLKTHTAYQAIRYGLDATGTAVYVTDAACCLHRDGE